VVEEAWLKPRLEKLARKAGRAVAEQVRACVRACHAMNVCVCGGVGVMSSNQLVSRWVLYLLNVMDW